MLRYIPWVTLVLGLWLIAAPYLFGFATLTPALANSVVVGLILAIGSCLCLYYQYRGAEAGRQPSHQRA